MILHQLVQWILLPNGLTPDGQLSASVFVAPRLRPDGPATLADFPDFADWPSQLAFELLVENGDGVSEAPLIQRVSASPALWQAIFPATTTVRPFAFADLADRPLISYPVGEVLDHLRERWTSLAFEAREELPVTNRNAAPIGPPPGDRGEITLSDHFQDLRAVGRRGIFERARDADDLSRLVRQTLDEAAAEARARRLDGAGPHDLIRPFGPGGDATAALYALAGFHARPSREQPKPFPADREQARAELELALDFHHHLSSLGDHPAMLRALGLVIDLVLRPDFVPVTNDGDPPTSLRLRVQRPSAFPARADDPAADVWNADVTPWTACRLTSVGGQAFFTAAERGGRQNFAHGFLRMDPTRYTPIAVDVDGLALKALNMAETLQNQEQQKQRPVEEPERDGVPTARTGGVALVHTGHAGDLHEDFQRARANDGALESDPDNPPLLGAEDLVRGYRIDIASDGRWRSLHRRVAAYGPERDPAQAIAVEDEGSIELSLTAEVDRPEAPADPDRPLYTHEALATWDGWSLSVPRPGDAIPQEPPVPEAGTDLGSMQLAIAASALPGSLPRLRFGSEYRVRARTVDLAGNSHGLADADRLHDVLEATGDPRYLSAAPATSLRYLRFEPVPPPDLVPRHPFGPGESLERLVIRSTPGESAEAFAEASQAAAEPFRYRPFCDRHVAAAKASLQLIEAHGLLDDAIEAVRDLDPEAAVAAAQQYYAIAARENGSFHDDPGKHFIRTGEHEGVPQGYVCIDADAVDLPHLPDPLGVGAKARFTLEPGEPEQVLEIPFLDGDGWHLPQPFRLRLAEGDYAVQFDGQQLTVALPAGRTARLRLSSLFANDPDIFGIMGWCREQPDAARAERVYDAIRSGTHWMTAPWRDIVLVHAVQRPLEAAQLELDLPHDGHRFSLARGRGATVAELSGRIFFDLPSTAQLDVVATWDELEDDPTQAYEFSEEMLHAAHRDVFSLAVPEPFGTPWIPEVAPLIEALDPQVVGFRTSTQDETAEKVRLRLLADAAAPGLTAPQQRRLEAGAAQLEKLRAHEFGDTRYRRVTYRAIAATRFREYFDPAMDTADGSSAGGELTVDVLSSAPPAKPVVLQILPLLRYVQSELVDGVITSRRVSVGLRVWLNRPWWSSGAGERLAVLCHPGPHTSETDHSRDGSMIVQDPAHASQIPLPLMREHFSNALPPEVGAHQFMATFEPIWDRGRQAWYCDLEFKTGAAYFPFVRLGLARFQRMSVDRCQLSPTVPTAFIQSVPDRTLTCALVPGEDAQLTLAGPAPSASVDAQGAVAHGTNVVAAVVEEQDPAFADPLLGWSAAGPETELAGVLAGDGTATWSGAVPLPPADGRRLRLAVREYEIHPADDRTQQPPGLVATRRLVHADVIAL